MKTLKLGDKGTEVKDLQMRLQLIADGNFGPMTQEAVKHFQTSHGLIADGIVGEKTWKMLPPPIHVGRNITEIIVHCTATREGRPVSVTEIKQGHLSRGFTDIGYHWVIYLDGTIVPGRSELVAGAHATGHNSCSIGISYVGGLASDGKTPKDTRTAAQKQAMIKIIKEIKSRYPNIKKILGHRETSPDLNHNGIIEPFEYIKSCPCFDASKEYASLL